MKTLVMAVKPTWLEVVPVMIDNKFRLKVAPCASGLVPQSLAPQLVGAVNMCLRRGRQPVAVYVFGPLAYLCQHALDEFEIPTGMLLAVNVYCLVAQPGRFKLPPSCIQRVMDDLLDLPLVILYGDRPGDFRESWAIAARLMTITI